MAFEARYPGRCNADCGMPILPGDRITLDDDDAPIHEQCAFEAPARAETVCPECFLTSCDHGRYDDE